MMNGKQFGRVFALGALALVLSAGLLQTVGAKSKRGPLVKGKTPITKVKVPEGREVATLAGGCFWSMEAIFKQLKGVEKVEPGYAGGKVAKPTYEQVGTSQTGHAESLQVTFDPKVISYGDLLGVMLLVHNPTTLDKQGADKGPQYRSAIFFHSKAQREAARAAIAKSTAAKEWSDPIVTTVEPFANFYRAEDYHLDYYAQHADEPYCKGVIAPKLAKFRAKFKDKLKSEPKS